MKTEWLVANVTAAGSPGRAERDIIRMIFYVFLSTQVVSVVEEPLCDVGIPLEH